MSATMPKLEGLTLRLYERPVHPELVDIYEKTSLTRKHFEADLWLTGCSHVISFRHESLWLVEVLAETNAELPTQGRLASMALGPRELEHSRLHCGRIRYAMTSHVETMGKKVYENLHDSLHAKGRGRGLFVEMTDWMARPPRPPFSWLDYDIAARSLHVFAFHAFPESRSILKVQSLFEWID
jgi:hypothetical protein